ncbi:MAG: nuclear transport factor 2 family protein [Candidatus Heimdallarchaeota archaeon]|nr:nuclear transport factor 2 family protein [Candidatus Heimdallarchaeota archaeon]
MAISEYDNVKKTMEIYIEGSRRLDYDKKISVVHPDARLFISEELKSKNLYEHWLKGQDRFKDTDRDEYYKKTTIEILSIEIEGKIASVKLNYNNWYYDFHNLIKIDSDWKIVDKVSHKI